ncbi:MAG: BatD family protein [Phycisphaerae bacterium]|nr:BatD family protein [Gemmatimonadaceae bacterium]
MSGVNIRLAGNFRVLGAAALLLLSAASIVAPAGGQTPAILKRVRVDPARVVDFHAGVFPETLFVGQQATYQVAVLLDEVTGTRLSRNPEYLPPELRGMLAYELGGQQRFSHEANGKRYTAHVFQKALFPLAEGVLTIPSPQLTYSLRQSTSYFSREESHSLRAESASVYVRALPVEGKPADFSGAVGVLTTSVHLDTATARVGDPLVITLHVQGSGNIKLLPRPTLEVEWATSVPSTERLQMDTSGAIVRGSKEFDWILTPTRDGDVTTPVIEYSYFNPNTRKYEVAEAAPVSFSVNAGGLANREEGEPSAAMLPLRTREVGTVPQPLIDRLPVLIALGLLPLPALALLLLGIPRAKPQVAAIESLRAMLQKVQPITARDSRAVSEQASLKTATPVTARDVRRLLLVSLARRLEVNTEVLTDRTKTARILRRRGVTQETAEAVLTKLSALDSASFAAANVEDSVATHVLSADVIALYDRVDGEALELKSQRRAKTVRSAGVFGSLFAAFVVGHASFSASQVEAQTATGWQAATSAYENHQFLDASTAFQQLAREFPRDADVLANWGTAAWAAGDTVTAVVAWQRAARLDPLAADIREHLMLLPSGSRDGIADVPLVPVTALGYAGIAFWSVGWILAAMLLWSRRKGRDASPVLNLLTTVLLLGGAASGGTAFWGARQLNSEGLAVVLRPETMRELPESEANALGGAATGDVVRIEEMAPMWARVEHADGRTGWIPADRLTPLTSSASQ